MNKEIISQWVLSLWKYLARDIRYIYREAMTSSPFPDLNINQQSDQWHN